MIALTPRALVVDDDPHMQALVGRTLAKETIVCDFAQDGAEALQKLERGMYDVVVTDLRMPNVNGHALCRSILERPDRPLLIAMTGVSDPRLQRDLEARGVDAIFEKPFDLTTFGGRLRSLIDNRSRPPAFVEEFPDEERTFAAGEAHEEPTRLPTVAILIGDPKRAAELASELGIGTAQVVVAETTDHLHRFAHANQTDVLVIENGRHGFLSAAEIVVRLQDSPFPPATIVVGDSPTFTFKQVHSLGIEGIVKADASVSELVGAVRHTLTNGDRSRRVSAKARTLVKSLRLNRHSPSVLLGLVDFLGMQPEQISVSQLARVVTADPATAAEIVRFANASSAGLRRPITEVADSLAYLGPSRAVTLLLSRTVLNIDRDLGRRLPAELRKWYHVRTILTASVASVFAERYFKLSGETAFVLGLFQDMGIRILANAFGDRYLNVIQHARKLGAVRLHVVERQSFGIDHAEVAAAILEHWRLPDKLVRPIRRHHESGGTMGESSDLAFLRPMRIGEAFADFADNQHPTRRDVLIKHLADCDGNQGTALPYQDSLQHAVRKSMEFAALFRLPLPDESLLAVCRRSLSALANINSGATDPANQDPAL